MDRSTQELNEEAARSKNTLELEAFLAGTGTEEFCFARHLTKLMREKHVTAGELAARTGLSDSHVFSLANGNRRPAKRHQVIGIGTALLLTTEEIDALLKDAGFRTLDAGRSPGDAMVIYGRKKYRDIDEIDQMMREKHAEYRLLPDAEE